MYVKINRIKMQYDYNINKKNIKLLQTYNKEF